MGLTMKDAMSHEIRRVYQTQFMPEEIERALHTVARAWLDTLPDDNLEAMQNLIECWNDAVHDVRFDQQRWLH